MCANALEPIRLDTWLFQGEDEVLVPFPPGLTRFQESILSSEAEWSQHKKVIDFSARPGGFRRAMVPNLPYFMVQFDHKGEKGYGHVIEGAADAQDEDGLEEGEKGGGEFPL